MSADGSRSAMRHLKWISLAAVAVLGVGAWWLGAGSADFRLLVFGKIRGGKQ